MSEEIYTKEEHFQDWKDDNLKYLRDEFFEERGVKSIDLPDEFEAYCRQEFKKLRW